MDAATLTRIAGELEQLGHDLEAETDHATPARPWTGARVDAMRRRAIVLIDEVLADLDHRAAL